MYMMMVDAIASLWFQLRHVLMENRGAFVPVAALVLVFWPLLLTMVVTVVAAWSWIFWLVTSIALGLLQVVYACYQFFMIAIDIFGLGILRTYSTTRTQVLYYFDFWSNSNRYNTSRKGRRRFWKQSLENAGSYENFLKIRIESVSEEEVIQAAALEHSKNLNRSNNISSDPALPPRPLKRSSSYTNGDHPTNNGVGQAMRNIRKLNCLPRNQYLDLASKRAHFRHNKNDSNSTSRLYCHDDHTEDSHAELSVEDIELGERTVHLLRTTTARLKEARVLAEREHSDEAVGSLKYLLTGVLKRNHLKLDDVLVENAQSVAELGRYGLTQKSRQLIRSYFIEVEKGLDWLAEAPLPTTPTKGNGTTSTANGQGSTGCEERNELIDRMRLVRKMKQNMGRTALMLSGGGAQAMYHTGVLRAIIEAKMYNDISVISGTSGGSLVAAMCALKTADELYTQVCIPTVASDYTGNGAKPGEQSARNIRWFPTLMEMGSEWLKTKLLVHPDAFRRTCEFYFSDYTFEEAFARTGKNVCITVSASRASSNTAQRLLLNHISTPHVTIASAVAASCALPGVMAPASLIAKTSAGVLEPFEVDGVEWIDGSVQADLPFQRISTMFAVSSFIVSQTNFHVLPFVKKENFPSRASWYWNVFEMMEWDIRNRALKLSRLGLFPKIFGQDVSKVFKQKYHGNLTIIPRFTTMQTFGLKVLENPSVEDMKIYLKYGQIATWPYLNAMRDMLRLEKALDDCLHRLEERVRALHPDSLDPSVFDDIDSMASGSMNASGSNSNTGVKGVSFHGVGTRLMGMSSSSVRDRESERLLHSNIKLERENKALREQLERLQRQQYGKNVTTTNGDLTIKKPQKEEMEDASEVTVEEGVWSEADTDWT